MPDFVKVAKVEDIPENMGVCVDLGERKVGLFKHDGAIYAIDDICTHAHAHLSEGEVTGDEVTCPLHFATFNLRTGECTGPPASEDVATYDVRVVGDDVEIEVP